MELTDVLRLYEGSLGSGEGRLDASEHFEQAANEVTRDRLGMAIAAAFHSAATPPFGQLVGTLFVRSNAEQQADVLNRLVVSLGPAAWSGATAGILGCILSGRPDGRITPEQASQLGQEDLQAIAEQAMHWDPHVVDRVGAFYAQHPSLIKSLGSGVLSAILKQISEGPMS